MSRRSDPSLLREWTERLEYFQRSQQTVGQFCNSVGCSVATFYYWKKKLTPGTSPKAASRPPITESAFLPLLARGTDTQSIRIRAGGGIRIALPSDALAALKVILRHTQRVA